ncbi:anaerobic sulfatase maturase [Photobacterium sagamiensis]|uniref:anaerobic sulfatase maturase n=1 Tax=Photobacterium sagamiensis TaxID=2910241 RepID=UPI003D0ED8B5
MMKNTKNMPFHVMAKPVSYRCNLKCDYCFYLEKEEYYAEEQPRMPNKDLELYVRDYIKSCPSDIVDFAWQGGEPTLAGLDFFEKAVELQKRYSGGKDITNSFQTNGIAINRKWAEFFAKNDFLIGISVDGEPEIHDRYRISINGRPTFQKVHDAILLLKEYQVEFNTLTVINDKNWNRGSETYELLKAIGSDNMQFIPIVELEAHSCNSSSKFSPSRNAETTPYSLPSNGYGQFVMDVFEEWKQKDIGKVYVQTFEMLLAQKLGMESGLCVFNEECGRNVIVEANGDVYSCDHFVYPAYNIGNIKNTSLPKIINSKAQRKFGRAKKDLLTDKCKECGFLSICNGGCPKHRVLTLDGQNHKHNYLCESYRQIFSETSDFFATAANSIHKMCS